MSTASKVIARTDRHTDMKTKILSSCRMVKETNTWLNMDTLIKRGQYSTMQSNT